MDEYQILESFMREIRDKLNVLDEKVEAIIACEAEAKRRADEHLARMEKANEFAVKMAEDPEGIAGAMVAAAAKMAGPE